MAKMQFNLELYSSGYFYHLNKIKIDHWGKNASRLMIFLPIFCAEVISSQKFRHSSFFYISPYASGFSFFFFFLLLAFLDWKHVGGGTSSRWIWKSSCWAAPRPFPQKLADEKLHGVGHGTGCSASRMSSCWVHRVGWQCLTVMGEIHALWLLKSPGAWICGSHPRFPQNPCEGLSGQTRM